MYIKKKDIGGLTHCDKCPYFKLKSENIFSDNDLDGIILECENHDACYRIGMKILNTQNSMMPEVKGE